MGALPQDDYDPVEILRVLPEQYQAQFRAEYGTAATAAQRPEGYGQLHRMLRRWRLRALAYSDPTYEARKEAARRGTGTWISAQDAVPGWEEMLRAAEHGATG
jgi:Ser/Thr protein kinase RdoA (MazF antagonist)